MKNNLEYIFILALYLFFDDELLQPWEHYQGLAKINKYVKGKVVSIFENYNIKLLITANGWMWGLLFGKTWYLLYCYYSADLLS